MFIASALSYPRDIFRAKVNLSHDIIWLERVVMIDMDGQTQWNNGVP